MSNPHDDTQEFHESDEDEQTVSHPQATHHEVKSVSIKMPPFWADSPEIWFAQVEARFSVMKITGDTAKYNNVVSAIESSVLHQVSDAILHAPPQRKYDNLKEKIIKRYSESSRRKLSRVLSNMPIGDKRPSHFLNELKHLCEGRLGDEILKTIWLNALPENMRHVLTSHDSATATSESLAVIADSMTDIGNSINQIATTDSSNSILRALDALATRIEAMETRSQQHGRERRNSFSKSKRRERSSSRDNGSAGPTTCWYHRNHGTNAKNCREPCNFKAGASNTSNR